MHVKKPEYFFLINARSAKSLTSAWKSNISAFTYLTMAVFSATPLLMIWKARKKYVKGPSFVRQVKYLFQVANLGTLSAKYVGLRTLWPMKRKCMHLHTDFTDWQYSAVCNNPQGVYVSLMNVVICGDYFWPRRPHSSLSDISRSKLTVMNLIIDSTVGLALYPIRHDVLLFVYRV